MASKSDGKSSDGKSEAGAEREADKLQLSVFDDEYTPRETPFKAFRRTVAAHQIPCIRY